MGGLSHDEVRPDPPVVGAQSRGTPQPDPSGDGQDITAQAPCQLPFGAGGERHLVPAGLEALHEVGELHLSPPPLGGGVDLQHPQSALAYGLASSAMSWGMSSMTG